MVQYVHPAKYATSRGAVRSGAECAMRCVGIVILCFFVLCFLCFVLCTECIVQSAECVVWGVGCRRYDREGLCSERESVSWRGEWDVERGQSDVMCCVLYGVCDVCFCVCFLLVFWVGFDVGVCVRRSKTAWPSG